MAMSLGYKLAAFIVWIAPSFPGFELQATIENTSLSDAHYYSLHRKVKDKRKLPVLLSVCRLYVCMFMFVFMVNTYSRVWINQGKLPILLVVS